MKTSIILLFLASFSVPAFADTPSAELVKVTRALINSPEIIAQLNKNNSAHLDDVKITAVDESVFQYELVFVRNCECIPSTATVKISEDLRPTQYDGSAIYKSTIEIQTGF